MFERKSKVVTEIFPWPVPFIIDFPGSLVLSTTSDVLLGNTASGANRSFNLQGTHERG